MLVHCECDVPEAEERDVDHRNAGGVRKATSPELRTRMIALVGSGLSVKTVAERLGVSSATVAHHTEELRVRLGRVYRRRPRKVAT